MAHGRSLSRLAVTGFVVTGVSCFANEHHFPRLYASARMMRSSHSASQPTGSAPLTSPPGGIRGGNSATSSGVSSALYGEPDVSTEIMPWSGKASAPSYYLIWSHGFLPKFSLMTTALISLHWTGVTSRICIALSQGWHTHFSGPLRSVLVSSFPNVLLPLLSSSCCLLQLVINALVGAGGCAGFNSVLGPLRPLFLSLLAYLNWSARPPLSQGILRLSLALLPEVVHLWNQWLINHWQQTKSFLKMDNATVLATVEVEIPSMGCVACVNKIDASLRQSAPDKILGATSWLDDGKEKGGWARVRLALKSRDELDSMNELILKSIDDAGFSGSHVVHTHVQSTTQARRSGDIQ